MAYEVRSSDWSSDVCSSDLRNKFLAADVGITGANFMIAETGSTVIVTNEGNGALTQTLPQVHIVLAPIEKMVPTRSDERRVGREGVSTCRSRWSPDH